MVRSIHLSHPGCPKKTDAPGTLGWNPQLDPLHVCDWHPDCRENLRYVYFAQVVHMYTIPKRIYGFSYMNTGNY